MMQKQKTNKTRRSNQGFTLVELMIVVAIIAILVGVAFPSYQNYVLRANRADALNALTDIANKEVQYFIENRKYGTVAELALPTANANGRGTTNCGANAISKEGYYCITIANTGNNPSSYLLTAIPQGPQAKDTHCANITYDAAETKGGTNSDCWGQ